MSTAESQVRPITLADLAPGGHVAEHVARHCRALERMIAPGAERLNEALCAADLLAPSELLFRVGLAEVRMRPEEEHERYSARVSVYAGRWHDAALLHALKAESMEESGRRIVAAYATLRQHFASLVLEGRIDIDDLTEPAKESSEEGRARDYAVGEAITARTLGTADAEFDVPHGADGWT